MPLSRENSVPIPGPSRKRSHAEITKSESRSSSPQPPSKRRRTTFNPPRIAPSLVSHPLSAEVPRFIGDGFDFRRPATSTADMSQPQTQETIDLTLDDDTPPPHTTAIPPSIRHGSTNLPGASGARAPPFGYDITQEVIDLSTVEDDEEPPQIGAQQPPASPEVQFLRERAVPVPPPPAASRLPRLPTPPGFRGGGMAMLNALRGATHFMLGGARENHNRLQGFMNHYNLIQPVLATPDTNYDNLHMDYGMTAFNMGGDLIVEDPNVGHQPQDRGYKAPTPAQPGFTRTYEEDDMLICPNCGDELATGTDEIKQQVWIIKQCGHTYCGDCATKRVISKGANARDRKSSKQMKPPFRACQVPGCNKDVTSKTKMFQIYL